MASTACMRRLQAELRREKGEPVPLVWVAPPSEHSLTHLEALVMGPPGTPYQYGFFIFSMRFPSDYPFEPPTVKLLTTDSGRHRFNPNLYKCGKVCLSILGTWEGPGWSSVETIHSVLISIQSIMNDAPYHNEPGYELDSKRLTNGLLHHRSNAAQHYSDIQRHETLRVAVCGVLETILSRNAAASQDAEGFSPTPMYGGLIFSDIVQRQFLLWYDTYVANCRQLSLEFDSKPFQDPFKELNGTFKYASLLERLQAIKETILNRQEAEAAAEDAVTMAPQREGSVQSAASFCYGQSLLQQELQRITGDPPVGISVSPRDGNILIWDVTLIGVDGSVVDGGFLSLTIRFLRSFPHSAPRVRFLSRMYHPNITADGTPCLDMLSGEWNPLWSLTSLLVSLHVMLDDVDLSCPVNAEAARLYQTDRRAYTQRVRRLLTD